MSHHLDSPSSRRDPRLNLTDTFVFDGSSGTAFVMVVNSSLAGAGKSAGFHPEARYEFKVHLDGSELEELTYRFSFGPRLEDGSQRASLHQLSKGDAREDYARGTLLAEGPTSSLVEDVDSKVRFWAGHAVDPFYLDLGQLGPILQGLQSKSPIALGNWTVGGASNSFAGSSIYAIVLEIPHADAQLWPGRELGVWSASKLATDGGGWRQINRAGIPMVWPLFRAIGSGDESEPYCRDTEAHPSADPSNDGTRVFEMIAAAAGFSGTEDPASYAQLVVGRLLPDLLPYRVGTSAHFGFAGFNGRRLADNAPEVMFSLITNSAFPTGLAPTAAADSRSGDFPYVTALPLEG